MLKSTFFMLVCFLSALCSAQTKELEQAVRAFDTKRVEELLKNGAFSKEDSKEMLELAVLLKPKAIVNDAAVYALCSGYSLAGKILMIGGFGAALLKGIFHFKAGSASPKALLYSKSMLIGCSSGAYGFYLSKKFPIEAYTPCSERLKTIVRLLGKDEEERATYEKILESYRRDPILRQAN